VIFSSCTRNTIIYYHNTEDYDGGEIRGVTQLYIFFESDSNIYVHKTKSKEIFKELNRIKKNILLRGDKIKYVKLFEDYEEVEDDYDFYDYSFVLNEKDTLYANMTSGAWRYNKQKLTIKSGIENLVKE
jgi:hypothetical protein